MKHLIILSLILFLAIGCKSECGAVEEAKAVEELKVEVKELIKEVTPEVPATEEVLPAETVE